MSSKKNKNVVGISITPNVGIEMVLLDKDTSTVIKYANRPLEYNYLQRNITNFEDIEKGIKSLFAQLDISFHSDVVLTLPTTEIKTLELSATIDSTGVENVVLSEIEQSFFFRNQEAEVRWTELINPSPGNKKYLYTAFQSTTVSLLKETLTGLGCNLLAIETSLASLLKGLDVAGIDEIKQNVNWNLIIIQPNSCCVMNMQGENLLDINDAPLAIKSFGEDEVYDILVEKIDEEIYDYASAASTIIVSKVDEVSAERLSKLISFANKKRFIENNSYATEEQKTFAIDYSVLPQYKTKISLEVVGSAAYFLKKYPVRFNFTNDIVIADTTTVIINGKEYPEKKIVTIYGFIMGVLLLATLGAYLSIPGITKNYNNEKADFDSKIKSIDNELNELKKANNSMEQDKEKIIAIPTANEKEYEYYQYLGRYAPNALWVTRYYTDNTGSLGIKGRAVSIDDIRKFMIGIASTKEPNIMLSKLKLGEADSFYDFEISNSAFKSTGGFESLEGRKPEGGEDNSSEESLKNVNELSKDESAPPTEKLPTDASKK